MADRSPNATKDEMQITIDLLRARGDSAIEILDGVITEVESLLTKVKGLKHQLQDVDDRLGIKPVHRKENAILMARRMLGEQAEGKSDEEVLRMIGAGNERATR